MWLVVSRYGRPLADTEKYIEKCSLQEEKFDLYMILEQWKKAADMAFKLKDQNRLIEVRLPHANMKFDGSLCWIYPQAGQRSRNPQIEAYVQELLNRL